MEMNEPNKGKKKDFISIAPFSRENSLVFFNLPCYFKFSFKLLTPPP